MQDVDYAFFIVAIFILGIGVGAWADRIHTDKKLIERGYKQYNQKTGKLEWSDKK